MVNHDLNKIRTAIAEQQGRRPRTMRRNKSHRPHLRPAPRTPGEAVLAVLSIVLTLLAIVFALSVAQMAAYWIGDHAQHHDREWPVFRALGFKPWHLGGELYLIQGESLEYALLPWLIVVALLTAVLARPYQAVVVALIAGLVPNHWWTHVPGFTFPNWVGKVIDKQRLWQHHLNPWEQWGILLLLLVIAMAWAERTQAT